ncbi:hypothetical protein ACS0TY_032615 [Phlomoides rotata]
MEESINGELVDRLSELPQGLIHLILSFLPMRDVVSTTSLSKSWKNLWTTVPYLNFRINVVYDVRDQNFVNQVLMLWRGTKIMKFEIHISYDWISYLTLVADMNLWLCFAIKNKVEDLKLHYLVNDEIMEDACFVPECLNSCTSIRELSLLGCNIQIHGPPSWNQLRSLRIRCYGFSYECEINQILLGSPQLEVFELCIKDREIYDNLSIRSTSLKKLVIKVWLFFGCHEYALNTMFKICFPNLEILEFFGRLDGTCWFSDVSSPSVDATLHFDVDYGCGDDYGLCFIELFGDMLRQVFSTYAEKVTLPDWYDDCGFEIFAKLQKMLVIQGLPDLNAVNYMEFESNLFNSFLLQLKTVEITSQLSDISIFGFIEFLLKHAVRLEELVLRSTGITSYRRKTLLLISEKLLSMPRSSPYAKYI